MQPIHPPPQGWNAPRKSACAAWFALGFLVLNAALKLVHLGAQPVSGDEPFTLFWAQQPLGAIWELAQHENNPPLHFVVAHFWLAAFGWSPWAFRLSSLLFSSLAAAWLYRSGNRHFGHFAGLVAALLFTFSTEHVYYSHELRCYPLLCLLTVAAFDRFLMLRQAPGRWQHYALLALIDSALIYTHFLGVWVLLAQCLLWPLMPAWRQVATRLAITMAAVGVAYAPNLPAVLQRVQSVAAGGTWVPEPHWTQLYGHVNYYLNGPVGSLGLIAVTVAGLVLWWRNGGRPTDLWPLGHEWRGVTLLMAAFLVMYGGIYLQSLLFAPAFIPRYLLFCSIPFFMAAGAMLQQLYGKRLAQGMALAVCVVAMLPRFDWNPPVDSDLRGLLAYVASERTAETPVLICPYYYDKTFAFHAEREAFRDPAHFRELLQGRLVFPVAWLSDLPPGLLDSARQLLYIDANADAALPANDIRDSLAARFPMAGDTAFGAHLRVVHYRR